jgi:hypothetical protein
MEWAAARGRLSIRQEVGQRELLGGEFAVQDMDRNEGALLQVRLDGVHILFQQSQAFIQDLNV